ncbi:MAG: response regulator transcription factor [Bacteroides sp.]|nr:response regulator transcription factor [Bacteroides sp.]
MPMIIVADNQDITSLGIVYICNSLEPVPEVKRVSGTEELVGELTLSPDAIVVVDYSLFDFSDRSELVILLERFCQVKWLFLERELTEASVYAVFGQYERAGMLWKGCSADELIHALNSLLEGRQYVCSKVERSMHLSGNGKEKKVGLLLTDTEQQILYAMVQGKSTRQIAGERNSSVHTVYTHKKNIFRKLKVRNVREAVRCALQHGLVDPIEYYI